MRQHQPAPTDIEALPCKMRIQVIAQLRLSAFFVSQFRRFVARNLGHAGSVDGGFKLRGDKISFKSAQSLWSSKSSSYGVQ